MVLAGALSIIGTAAMAQEQLLMPYACSAAGGRVMLTPTTRDEPYRIYGEHEQRPFTVCSPINPNVCRTWLLHRFDLDCGGARVNWLSIVEAASDQTTGRAWVEDGRLLMRMNQYWGRDVGPDDPCPRWGRRGRFGDCADRAYRNSRSVIEMPPGFAPAFGLPVRFARLDGRAMPADPRALPADPRDASPDPRYVPFDPRAQSDDPRAAPSDTYAGSNSGTGPAYPGTAYSGNAPAKSARIEPPRDVAAKDPLPKAAQVAGSTTTTPAAKAPAKPAATTSGDAPTTDAAVQGEAKAKRPETVREAAAEPAIASGSGAVVPKIINRPGTEQTVAEKAPATRIIPLNTDKASEPAAPKVADSAPKAEPQPQAVAPKRVETPEAASSGHSALSAFAPSSTTQAVVGFFGLVAAALALFAWTRHREQASLAAAGRREIGAVSFDGRMNRKARPSTGTAVVGPRPAGVAAHRPPPLPGKPVPTSVPVADGQMPRTREDACRVLGANPDAGEAAIKKIVEGLRQSWHPDLATGDADRRLREQRTTQINVAWDILSGRRPAA